MNLLPSILLVEDDPGDASLALAVLTQVGLSEEVCVVSDGVFALDFLHARGEFAQRAPGRPALVLLDLKMPRVDGFEVLERMRSDPALRPVPVVVFSSSGEERDIGRAYELGANGYVVKSIDFHAYSKSLRAVSEFWMSANEPPPGCVRRHGRNTQESPG